MSANAIYTKPEPTCFVTGRGLRNLCEKLTKQGWNKEGIELDVLLFDNDELVTKIKWTSGAWMKLVPEHWQTFYKPRNTPLPKYAEVEE